MKCPVLTVYDSDQLTCAKCYLWRITAWKNPSEICILQNLWIIFIFSILVSVVHRFNRNLVRYIMFTLYIYIIYMKKKKKIIQKRQHSVEHIYYLFEMLYSILSTLLVWYTQAQNKLELFVLLWSKQMVWE